MKKLAAVMTILMFALVSFSGTALAVKPVKERGQMKMTTKNTKGITPSSVFWGYGGSSVSAYVTNDPNITFVEVILNGDSIGGKVPARNIANNDSEEGVMNVYNETELHMTVNYPGKHNVQVNVHYGQKISLNFETDISLYPFNVNAHTNQMDNGDYIITYNLYPNFDIDLAMFQKANIEVNGYMFDNLDIIINPSPWDYKDYQVQVMMSAEDFNQMTVYGRYFETTFTLTGHDDTIGPVTMPIWF